VKRGQRFRAAAALPGGVIPLTLSLFVIVSCSPRTPLPVLGEVPPFQLTSQSGETFERKSLDGHVWVADFMFTSCPGPCPRMSSQMHQIQTATAGTPDVKLVSFTVDPAHDTPEVLAAYGKHFLAQPGRWYFLTGPQNRLDEIGRAGFKLNLVDGSLDHSTRFVLIDRRARIRGYYASSDDGFPSGLLRDLRQLERES